MIDEEYLSRCMELCEVEEIDHGHQAKFMGVPGTFQCSWGPNEWTREMACKSALMFWALKERDKGVKTAVFMKGE